MAGRVEASPSLLPFSFAVLLLAGGTVQLVQGQKTWCVAKPSSDEATLLANINYACSHVDCSILRRGCPCFYPDNLMSHASIAMNLYYQAEGRNHWNCYFKDSGLITKTDPSKFPDQPYQISLPEFVAYHSNSFPFRKNKIASSYHLLQVLVAVLTPSPQPRRQQRRSTNKFQHQWIQKEVVAILLSEKYMIINQ